MPREERAGSREKPPGRQVDRLLQSPQVAEPAGWRREPAVLLAEIGDVEGESGRPSVATDEDGRGERFGGDREVGERNEDGLRPLEKRLLARTFRPADERSSRPGPMSAPPQTGARLPETSCV